MSDRLRMLEALRSAGDHGMHTHDLRQLGYSGNPSERVRELRRRGFVVSAMRERRGRRNGTRYTLIRDLGDDVASITESALEAGVGAEIPVSGSTGEGVQLSADSGSEVSAGRHPHAHKAEPPAGADPDVLFNPDDHQPRRGYADLEEAA